ncbi:MAG: hypothetical protein L3J08_08015 [Flavobacteriaceae bacterium]|nr:hypothetical protein [Flavobacteriaceae bacterium]
MKDKKKIYILIPVVLLVWGIIAYRIFASINPSNKIDQIAVKAETFKPTKITKKEIFYINADYRDPFLGTLAVHKKKTVKKIRQPKVKEKVVFPSIKYKGIFSSSKKTSTIFLIMINGKQQMYKTKETYQDIKLLKGDKEKITLKYKTKKQTFYLQ